MKVNLVGAGEWLAPCPHTPCGSLGTKAGCLESWLYED